MALSFIVNDRKFEVSRDGDAMVIKVYNPLDAQWKMPGITSMQREDAEETRRTWTRDEIRPAFRVKGLPDIRDRLIKDPDDVEGWLIWRVGPPADTNDLPAWQAELDKLA